MSAAARPRSFLPGCHKSDVSLRFSVRGTSDLGQVRSRKLPVHAIDRLNDFFSLRLKLPKTVPETRHDGASARKACRWGCPRNGNEALAMHPSLARAEGIEEGDVERCEAAGTCIAVFDVSCTHAYAHLPDGDIDGETVECPLHQDGHLFAEIEIKEEN
ncbi:Rieske 2Fe-2S domain-containing protein [Caballeronia sp. LjRoot31]|uniref:Rieske 2Fe-2S domain-containing protein n=1 Tax=Caballeronia sp. LjRoot31 TaxID=3342324 RepID=UPI003ECF7FA3